MVVKTSFIISLPLEQVLSVYCQLGLMPLFSVLLLQSQLPHKGSDIDTLGSVCSLELRCLQNLYESTVLSICPSAENQIF